MRSRLSVTKRYVEGCCGNIKDAPKSLQIKLVCHNVPVAL